MGLRGLLRGVLSYAFGRRIETTCPFCHRKVTLDMAACQSIHALPACKTFVESEDAADFVKRMRIEIVRQRKQGN